MNSLPFFSVIIPLYNKEKFIERAINSVLNQTMQNFELIIIDDGSTDKSLDVVKFFNDDRIRLISKKNEGVSIARNTGILISKSDYIAFLDADDEWLVDFLETIQNLISRFPEAKTFSTAIKRENKNGDFLDIYFSTLPEHPWSGEINLFKVLAYDASPVTSSSVCVHKDVFKTIGMFPIGIKRGEDLDTWIRIFLNYKIAFSTIHKVIIHDDYDGGSMAINGLDEKNLYAFLELEKRILNNEVPDKLLDDAKKTMSRLLGLEIDSYIVHKKYSLALRYILDKRMSYLPMKRNKLLLKLLLKYIRVL